MLSLLPNSIFPLFGHFSASCQLDIVDHHPKHIPHLMANRLHLAPLNVASDSTYTGDTFLTSWLFFGHPVVGLCRPPPRHLPYRLLYRSGPLTTLGSSPWPFSSDGQWLLSHARLPVFVSACPQSYSPSPRPVHLRVFSRSRLWLCPCPPSPIQPVLLLDLGKSTRLDMVRHARLTWHPISAPFCPFFLPIRVIQGFLI